MSNGEYNHADVVVDLENSSDRVDRPNEAGFISDGIGSTSLAPCIRDAKSPAYISSMSQQHSEPHTCESDQSEDDDEEDDIADDSDDEDNDWSGQDDNLEAIVIECLRGDLELAALWIPILHQSCYSKQTENVKQIVGPWRHAITKCSPGDEGATGAQTPSSTARSNEATGSSRKRQRRYGSTSRNRQAEDHEDDEDEEEDNGDSKGLGEPSDIANPVQTYRLACPFHKRNSGKYCIQHSRAENPRKTQYRACEGPGFKNIQRLKYALLSTISSPLLNM